MLVAARSVSEREGFREGEGRRARRRLHVKTLIGVTCSETSYGRTVPTFHGPRRDIERVQGLMPPAPCFILPENPFREQRGCVPLAG